MQKTIINFCPTGMVPTKALTPHVPVSPAEIIEQVHEAYEIGITIAHLHARDESGIPTYTQEVYGKIFEGVRKHCSELIICGSTSGRTFPEFEKRSAVIELKPDMCSLTLSSLNFVKQASVNAPKMIKSLSQKMQQYGVNAELECFDLGMINFGKYLIQKELLKGPFYWNLIFGNIAGMQAKKTHFEAAIKDIDQPAYIGMGALGDHQLSTAEMAIKNGYGVRIGLEDNIWWDKKAGKLATNLQLIKYAHEKISEHGTTFMTPKELGEKGLYNTHRN
jgi:uncharacterized protein (DUF849 family)